MVPEWKSILRTSKKPPFSHKEKGGFWGMSRTEWKISNNRLTAKLKMENS